MPDRLVRRRPARPSRKRVDPIAVAVVVVASLAVGLTLSALVIR